MPEGLFAFAVLLKALLGKFLMFSINIVIIQMWVG